MFWLLSVVSIAITGLVIAEQPIYDYLPRSLVEQFPPIDLTVGSIGLYLAIGIIVSVTPVHRFVHYSATVVHELGHAFTSGLLGARPKNIQIHPSGAGIAMYQAPAMWARWRRATVTAAGYPAPAIAGLAGIMAAQNGLGAMWVLFTAAVLLLSVILIIRNFWGFFWSSCVVGVAYAGVTQLPEQQMALIGVAMSGFLLTEAMRDAREQIQIVRLIDGSGADADQIGRWYNVDTVLVARIHFVLVVAISGYALWISGISEWDAVRAEATTSWNQLVELVRDL